MPIFNEADRLSKSIESLLGQTFYELELIIVNDCSTHNSLEIMKYYEQLDNRIKVISNDKNSRTGPIEWESRNDGLKYATCKFIAYLDGDNTWGPNFI
jgi:glycosyltransferase involved in cell wall biosynthesis